MQYVIKYSLKRDPIIVGGKKRKKKKRLKSTCIFVRALHAKLRDSQCSVCDI